MAEGLGFSTDSCHNRRDWARYQRNPAADRTMMEHRMADGKLPDIETLRKLLAYDPETGVLTWLPRPVEMFPDARAAASWNTRNAGKPAFTAVDGEGYRQGRIFGRNYRAHRVAWAIFNGGWPAGQVDHINGARYDNRIANLRDVTNAGNQRNTKLRRDNTSGAMGVCMGRRRGKWRAYIGSDAGRKHLGTFKDFDAAVSARKAAEREFGYSPNHGRDA